MPGVSLRDTSGPTSLQDTNIRLRPPAAEDLPNSSQGPPDQSQGLNGTNQPREGFFPNLDSCLETDI